ncbi:anti-sigma factor family protein [Parasphaerochaeta coccoides]|uniref:Putative zinc-finger domain-containing protein n=1 Tax=Parasphaerochaeta coccoides (strain ATCC BAA-1237 / DSM 17374 / SPN1) TaxID=760011 RepID=F4GHS2_PARC1|nr:zf-HC2 domain-containing protein [Parasphaerochaeta coccoides]AEC01610.1 hypothetical protein Spico_0381 [Parasphaerochaeta coccoides DSM 17374]
MCLDDQILDTYLDGELAEPWKTQVEEHLGYCPACKVRLDHLDAVRRTIRSAVLTDKEIESHRRKVLSYMENNYFARKKKVSFFRKKLNVGIPALLTSAAAFVVVFVGAFVLFGINGQQTAEIIPEVSPLLNQGNIVQVRATDNAGASRTLDDYSLEEILTFLNTKGYNVDVSIRTRNIIPLDSSVVSSPSETPSEDGVEDGAGN